MMGARGSMPPPPPDQMSPEASRPDIMLHPRLHINSVINQGNLSIAPATVKHPHSFTYHWRQCRPTTGAHGDSSTTQTEHHHRPGIRAQTHHTQQATTIISTQHHRLEFEAHKRDAACATGKDEESFQQSLNTLIGLDKFDYFYLWSWMGVPIIQLPVDILATQEVIWRTKTRCHHRNRHRARRFADLHGINPRRHG